MEPTTKTYSSTYLRERDKIVEEKHQKDIAILEQKVNRLKYANNETLKRLYEAQTRGDRLAKSLGFNDIYEAQVTIDTADCDTPYKACFERVETLQVELSGTQTREEGLQALVDVLERDQEQLQGELLAKGKREEEYKADASRQRSASGRLAQELKQLQERFDALADVKERAAARYKVDYAKWRRFKDWIFTEEAEHAKDRNETGISEEEKRNRYMASLMRKKKMMMEIGPDLRQDEGNDVKTPSQYSRPPPLGGITNFECDKENLATLSVSGQHTRRTSMHASSSRTLPPSATMVAASASTIPPASGDKPHQDTTPSLQKRPLNSVAQETAPSSSPTLFINQSSSNTTRRPLIFHPIVSPQSPQIKQEAGSSPPISSSHRPPKRQHPGAAVIPSSSDTEDDSQAVGHYPAPTGPFKVPRSPATSPAPVASSQTEADSQSQLFVFPDPTPCPPRPVPKTLGHPSLPARPTGFSTSHRVVSRDADSFQPTKMRRLSDEHAPCSSSNSAMPRPKNLPANGEPSANKGKGKEVPAPLSTPANLVRTAGQKRLEDYSAFKGRGRYAKDTATAKDSINAQFQINPDQNGGMDFQYEEVVRGKDDRRRMDAGDCECCRDYYEAVGPLPNRLQAPLWRSPPNTPAKPCARHQQDLSASGSKNMARRDDHRQSEINSHRQAISRHRHHWERAKTPPGYWNIGFPDTQETADINEQAREMHRKKRLEIEAAARKEDGRYRRRS